MVRLKKNLPRAKLTPWSTLEKRQETKGEKSHRCLLHEKQGEYPNRINIKSREMHERRPQLLQKHCVPLANLRSAKFLHNKNCGFFPPHFSRHLLPSSLPIADKGRRKDNNRKNLRTGTTDLRCSGFLLLWEHKNKKKTHSSTESKF